MKSKPKLSKHVATVKEVAEILGVCENHVRYGIEGLQPLQNMNKPVRYSRQYLNEFFNTNIFTI